MLRFQQISKQQFLEKTIEIHSQSEKYGVLYSLIGHNYINSILFRTLWQSHWQVTYTANPRSF